MKIRNILFILLAILGLSACNDNTEPRLSIDSDITLEPLAVNSLEITDENISGTVLTLKWAANVDATVSTVLRYAVQIDLQGNDFSNGQLFADTEELFADVKGEDLNNILTKSLKQEPYVEVDYEVRMVVVAKNKNGKLVLVPGTAASASQKIQIIATRPIPDDLYMVGTEPFGNWDWASKNVVTMAPVNGQPGEFWAVKYLTKADKIQWAPAKESKDAYGKLEELVGYSVDDDNRASVDTDGLYMIYISYKKGTITIEPAVINGIGDCFGGWDEGESLFTIDGNLAKITTIADGNLRISASSSAAASDWWRREFVLKPSGVIEYRGNGGDQKAVPLKAGQTVTLDFNKNTGTFN